MSATKIQYERPATISPGSYLSKIPITVEISEEYKSDSLHWHDYIQIWYVAEGSLRHTINGMLYIQNAGSVVAVPPYATHNIDTRDSKTTPRFAMISFTDKFMTDNGYNFFSYIGKYAHFEGRKLPVFRVFSNDECSIADDIINDIHVEFSNKKKMSYPKLSSLLANFLALMTADSEKCDPSRIRHIAARAEDVTRAIRYMSEHYAEKITLDKLCDIAHMSRRFLTKNFHEVTGKTAFEILGAIRINNATASLLYSDLTLSEIAANVGFTTKNRLWNEFVKRFGISPIEYRNMMQKESLEKDERIIERWDWLSHPEE